MEDDAADPHVRFGLGLMGSSLNGPVGMDGLAFGFTKSGHYLHKSQRTVDPNGQALIFGQGDRVGCSISVKDSDGFPPARPDRKIVDYFRIYFEEKLELPRETALSAEIRFYVNGKTFVEPAFSDLPLGVYYPMISLYRGARVKFIAEAVEMKFIPDGFDPWAHLFSCVRLQHDSAEAPGAPAMAMPEISSLPSMADQDLCPQESAPDEALMHEIRVTCQ